MDDSGPLTIADPEQISSLASPVRQEIVDTVKALGPCSVAEVADELGRPADGLYYHLRRLLRSGLLVEAGERAAARGREKLYASPGGEHGIQLRYAPADPDNVEAVTRVVGGMMRVTERDFAAALSSGRVVVEGPLRDLWAARMKGWLSDAELAEARGLLDRLRELFERPRRGDDQRLHALTFVIAPVSASRRRG